MELIQIVEALIFASPEPLTVPDIAKAIKRAAEEAEEPTMAMNELANVTVGDVAKAIDELETLMTEQKRPEQLSEGPGGWRMVSRPEYADYIRALIPGQRPERLSPPALETLALIAYRQPITKADIEAVRGVSVDGVLSKVIDRGLIKIGGRADLPGRPLLYETTDLFLEHFGVKDLNSLPNAAELRQIDLPTATPEEEKSAEAQMNLKGIVEEGAAEGESAIEESPEIVEEEVVIEETDSAGDEEA